MKMYPHRIAIKTRRQQWSYDRLNNKANLVARSLIANGGGSAITALLLGHDPLMVAGLLGALKAGNAYLPMDATHPLERLAFMLDQSGADAILTDEARLGVATELAKDRPCTITIIDEAEAQSAENLGLAINPDALSYILYTSGSTGQPKGVMQNHRNVLAHIRNYTNNLHISYADALTLFSSYCFDAAVMDIFGALLNGATLCPVDVKADTPGSLVEAMTHLGVTIYHSTPAVFRYLVSQLDAERQLSGIRLVVLGGEEASQRDVESFKKHFSPTTIFINGLGPTESTVSLQYFIDKQTKISGKRVPVGYPVEGTEVLLINEAGQEGEVYGEIAIASPHLALGYLNRPDLTRAAFVEDQEAGGKRTYRTGDMGRLLADGAIEFLGRKDLQTKIRGYRIELEEVEAALIKYEGIREAAVAAIEQGEGEKLLAAFIVEERRREG